MKEKHETIGQTVAAMSFSDSPNRVYLSREKTWEWIVDHGFAEHVRETAKAFGTDGKLDELPRCYSVERGVEKTNRSMSRMHPLPETVLATVVNTNESALSFDSVVLPTKNG